MPVNELQEVFSVFTPTVMIFSLFSGIGAYLQRVRTARIKSGVIGFAAELVAAVIAGAIVSTLCTGLEMEDYIRYVLILIAANNATDLLTALHKVTEKTFIQLFKKGCGK